jgi:hypothetical protein
MLDAPGIYQGEVVHEGGVVHDGLGVHQGDVYPEHEIHQHPGAIIHEGHVPHPGAIVQPVPAPMGIPGPAASDCNNCGSSYCGGCDSVPACGCENGCDGFDCPSSGILDDGCMDCELGDPYTLLGHCGNFKMGGWVQLGYHNKNLQLFNNRKNEYQLHQAWLYAEKELDTCNGYDIGGRIDYVYGTDAQNTQAFGISNSHWDNSWDNGSLANGYGNALPQVYFEAGYGDFRIKAGKFFTIIGYEVVTAPDNFFYSHAYTFNYSEPFTHTGALITYNLNEDVEVYGGYVMGWDSGFEDNGDAYLGGASITLTEDITITSTTVGGRLNEKLVRLGPVNLAERGWMHSTVAEVKLTDRLDYVFQQDILNSEIASGQGFRETYGINQYLFHTLNDCFATGLRFEWWNVDRDSFFLTGGNEANFYTLTLGANIKPHANIVVRPEIRWDWQDPSLFLEDSASEFPFDGRQTTFGIDSIILF